jgi:hypothetical protein
MYCLKAYALLIPILGGLQLCMRGGTTEDEVGRTRWANPVGPITVEGVGWQ